MKKKEERLIVVHVYFGFLKNEKQKSPVVVVIINICIILFLYLS